MAELRYLPSARQDLAELWTNYAVIDENLADKILARIEIRVHQLARHPFLGRARPEFDLPELRSTAVSPHVIFYSVSEDGIVFIHRVLDGRRDLPNLLKSDSLE